MRRRKRNTALTAALVVLLWMVAPLGGATEIKIDGISRKLLERELLSGGDFHYPVEAATKKEGGTCGCLMHLGPTGHVISLRVISSSGHVILDNHVMKVLSSYRFKAGTQSPIRWYITFRPERDQIQVVCLRF